MRFGLRTVGPGHTRLHHWQLALIFVNFDCKISRRLNRNHLTNSMPLSSHIDEYPSLSLSLSIPVCVCVFSKLMAFVPAWWALAPTPATAFDLASASFLACIFVYFGAHARIFFYGLMAATTAWTADCSRTWASVCVCVYWKYSQKDCVNKLEIMALSSNMRCSFCQCAL